MMMVLWVVLPLLSLAGFVGFLWMCVVAFRRHPGWGVAVLLLSPISAIVFAIRYWQDSKRPFLVYMGSFAACLGLGFYVMASLATQMMAMAQEMPVDEMTSAGFATPTTQGEPEPAAVGALDPEAEAELRRMQASLRDVPEFGDQDAGSAPQAPRMLVGVDPGTRPGAEGAGGGNLSDMVPPGFRRVPVGEAVQHLGKNVRILSTKGKEIHGKLADAGPGTLLLERELSGGTVTFEMSAREVETLLVAYR